MSQLRLLGQRRFAPLFWTQFFGAFNDNFLKNAMVILVTFRSAQIMDLPAAQMISVIGAVFIAPFFLFSGTAGQIADKYEKSVLIRVVKVLEVLIMGLACYGFITGQFTVLLVSLFLMGLQSTLFGPVKFSILPQQIEERDLVGANALMEAGTFLAILLGTIAGGELISIPERGASWVCWILMTLSILGLVASFWVPRAEPASPQLRLHKNPFTPTWEILQFTRQNRAVYLSILGASWFWFFGAALLLLIPPFCKEVLRASESVVSLFLACFSVGVGIGSLLCEKLSRRRIDLGLVPLGSIGMSVFAADLFFSGATASSSLPSHVGAMEFLQSGAGFRIVLDLLGLAIFSGFFIVPLFALVQARSEVAQRSRIIAGNNILNALFIVLASVMVYGMTELGYTIPQMFLTMAVLNAVVAIYIYLLLPEFLLRFFAWVITHLLYRFRVEGEENIPDRGPALLVCNHVSFVDWLIIGAGVPRPTRFVMHYKFAQGAFGKWMIKRAKVIPIAGSKEDPAILEAAFGAINRELQNGQLVCIFPEGQLSADGNLAPFKPGVERILKRTPVPVIPMALQGMWGSYFSRSRGRAMKGLPKRIWFRVKLKMGVAIPPDQASAVNLQSTVQEMLQS